MEQLRMELMQRISKQFPTVAAAATEIINLSAILNLPMGSELFLADLHGEHGAFAHVAGSGSGTVRIKVEETFGASLSAEEKKALTAMIVYPQEKMEEALRKGLCTDEWMSETITRLVAVTKRVVSKYTRSKVRKALPEDFRYVIEELITEKSGSREKEEYFQEIIRTVIRLDRGRELIIALARLIRRLVIDRLHVLGDIYDRGREAHMIMDDLMQRAGSVDIQWGNHDIVWMGAAAGSLPCIFNVIRMCARYGSLDVLENYYEIDLRPLSELAAREYGEVSLHTFSIIYDTGYDTRDLARDMKTHKAAAILQMKLEGQTILRHPEFHMEERLLLDKIDFMKKRIRIGRRYYPLRDTDFPTVSPRDPYALTPEEEKVAARLADSFRRSERLQRHVRFLFTNGSMYLKHNGSLLYHGCIPMDKEGRFRSMEIGGKTCSGKALSDALEYHARQGYFARRGSDAKAYGQDILWYLWTGPVSPLFGKDRATTFERYFVEEKNTHKETQDPYYKLIRQPETAEKILAEFGLGAEGTRIINGHVDTKRKKGESPVLCGGRVIVVDSGNSAALAAATGKSGATLVADSAGLRLSVHERFGSAEEAALEEKDYLSGTEYIVRYEKRRLVRDTDTGTDILRQISQLEELLGAYREGALIERS